MFLKGEMFERLLCCRRRKVEEKDEEPPAEEVVLQHTNNNATEYITSEQLIERLKGGTTAVVALVRERRLVVAWLGDSQALLARQRKPVKIVEPHKPELAIERERVEKFGGYVINVQGTWRVLGQLAVSRAIGDSDYKPLISSECDIKSLDLEGNEDFLVLACDGLWDTLTPDDAVHIVFSYLHHNQGDTEGVGRCLVEAARSAGSDDNITAVVVFLRPVDILMEEEAARIAQGQVPEHTPATMLAKDSTPSSLDAIFSSPTFSPPLTQFEVSSTCGSDMSPFSPYASQFVNSFGMPEEDAVDSPQMMQGAQQQDLQAQDKGDMVMAPPEDDHRREDHLDRPDHEMGAKEDSTFKDQGLGMEEDDEDLPGGVGSAMAAAVAMATSGASQDSSDSDEGVGGDDGALGEEIHTRPTPTAEEVDAALAELDSLPEEVCESGDVEEEEEEEEEWSYFRMEPQTHKRAEEEFVSNTMPESDMPEVGGQQEQQQQQDVVEYNNDLAPTHFGGPPMTPEELDAPFGIPQAMDVEHAMPMEAAVAPVMEKSFGLDASPSSPRAGSPPRSVEGFITSVEVNTPEESFATSVSINQSADMFTNPGVEQSGPFSVYVSNSPEPASMDPPTFPAGPPAHLEPSSPTAAASPALGSEVEAPASPKSSAEPTVEIVHAQSLVEVDSPPSPVDAPTAFPSSLDLGADSPAPSHPSDPVQSDSLLADNSFTDEPVTEPITDALVDFASKADIQPREAADSPGAPLTPATPVSPQLDLLDQMEQNEGKIEDQFMSRPFESEFIPGHMPHPMLDPMTQSMHFDEPIPTSVEMESPNDYERDLLAPQMNKSGDYREPVETTTAAQEAIISPKVPDEFSSGLFAPTSPEMASVESPDVVPVESPQVAPVESPEVVLVESLRETPVKSTEEVPVKSPEVAPVKTPETPVGAKKATKGVKATPGKATPGKATPTPGRAANRTTPAREATAKGTPGTTSRATPSRGTPGTTSRGTPGTTPRATPGTTPRATRGTTSTPGTKPTTGKTTTPSRAETSKTAPSKPDVKKSTLSKTTSAKPAPTTTAPKPSTRPTAAPRTTTKPTPKTAPTSKPTTTSRTTTTRPTATKPTPTSRPTTKPTGPGEAKKPTTTRPTPRPTSSTVGTASSRTTTTARRPTTAPRTDGKSATDGPSRSLTARKPMTTKTAVDSKDSKNTTNRILSASRTTSTTKSATATKTSSTTKSIASRTSTTTTSKMNGTTAPSKTRTTTAASKTATKTSSGVGIKKTAVSATAKTTGTKTKITEVAASATEVKMEPILNGENKIVDEETSVEVVEKLEAEKSSITSTEVVEESSITSSQVVEKIICETSSSEQVVTAEQMSTELLVNGDH
ncbi:uncharacterized protein LOC143023514 isoform X3 [Oratosquilla oratoria]|uniref:uncharacterized protein LOC143023514 isoform X3 n=1 Tax=Oratosquilla oratoria TaxID=337810 RepID=UPI003F76EF59